MAKRLGYKDRVRLEGLLKMPLLNNIGLPINQMARIELISAQLGVNSSTIYREVHKNGFTYNNYDANEAHNLTLRRVSKGNIREHYSQQQKSLILKVFKELAQNNDCSLGTIKSLIAKEFPEIIDIPSLETLYNWIYQDASNGGELYKLLKRPYNKRRINLQPKSKK